MDTNKQKQSRMGDVSRTVLQTIGTAGILSVALIAPNAVQVVDFFGIGLRSRRRKQYIKSVVFRLVDQGFIKFEKTKKGTFLRLTKKGEERLTSYTLGTYQIATPKHWDKKYRIIIFDIHEYRRGIRDQLRIYLQQFGFVRLQNSVWVYPYECRELVTLLKASFKIGKDILYIEAGMIENDAWLKKHFNIE